MTTLATSAIAREDAKIEVQRFLEYCRNRNAEHKRPAHRPVSNNVPRLLAWLSAQPEPQTIDQMAAALGVRRGTVEGILARNRNKFEQAGALPRVGKRAPVKLWRARGS